MGRKSVLPEKLKSGLAEYCAITEKMFYGLRLSDNRRMGFLLAINSNFGHTVLQQGKSGLRTFSM